MSKKKKITQSVPYFNPLLGNLCISNGDLNLYAGLDADGGDLLDDLRWTAQIDEPLVDAHLEAIPSLGTFTARSLPGGDAQGLKGR